MFFFRVCYLGVSYSSLHSGFSMFMYFCLPEGLFHFHLRRRLLILPACWVLWVQHLLLIRLLRLVMMLFCRSLYDGPGIRERRFRSVGAMRGPPLFLFPRYPMLLCELIMNPLYNTYDSSFYPSMSFSLCAIDCCFHECLSLVVISSYANRITTPSFSCNPHNRYGSIQMGYSEYGVYDDLGSCILSWSWKVLS
jgi:hypothetical protein